MLPWKVFLGMIWEAVQSKFVFLCPVNEYVWDSYGYLGMCKLPDSFGIINNILCQIMCTDWLLTVGKTLRMMQAD